MASLNKVFLIGNLGADPEIRTLSSGSMVANWTMATSESWTDKQGQRQQRTEWHRIVAWNRLAELAQNYISIGSQIMVEGKLQTRSWEDQQGQKRQSTEVIAVNIQLMGSADTTEEEEEDELPEPAPKPKPKAPRTGARKKKPINKNVQPQPEEGSFVEFGDDEGDFPSGPSGGYDDDDLPF